MRAVIQRVTRAAVTVDGTTVGEIGPGLLVLVGVTHTDTPHDAAVLARKVHELRILRDEQSLATSSAAEALVVSQFTLYGDTRRGRRPSWSAAAPRQVAEAIYDLFSGELEQRGVAVSRGVFGADMQVELVNDGPVTLLLET